MISPRTLFQKEPFASEVQDFIKSDKFQAALSYALAETAIQNGFNADQLSGAKLFIAELLVVGERPTEGATYQQPMLTQPTNPR